MQANTTLRSFLTQSLKLIGVVPESQRPTAAQLEDTKYHLNLIQDNWSTKGGMIFTMTTQVVPLANGYQQADGTTIYTIGPDYTNGVGAKPSIILPARPQYLQYAAFRQGTQPINDIPLAVLTATEWGLIRSKAVTTSVPAFIYMDGQWPVANLYLWPNAGNAGSLYLVYWQGFGTNSSLDDTMQFPPGYERAFLLACAISVAPQYNKEASPTLVAQLAAIERDIEWTNLRVDRLTYPGDAQGAQARGGAYDIYSDSVY